MQLCTYIKLYTRCHIGGSAKEGISNRVFFRNFCRDFLRFLAHPVAIITKGRQILDDPCTEIQREFVFCRYRIGVLQRCICFLVTGRKVTLSHRLHCHIMINNLNQFIDTSWSITSTNVLLWILCHKYNILTEMCEVLHMSTHTSSSQTEQSNKVQSASFHVKNGEVLIPIQCCTDRL